MLIINLSYSTAFEEKLIAISKKGIQKQMGFRARVGKG